MIKLHIKGYCENCTEFKPETQTNVMHGLEGMVYSDTSVTCKHAQRCECIREFIEKEMKKKAEK